MPREETIPTLDPNTLARAQAGDADAMEEIARAWYGRIRRWALFELGDPTLAEDAVQEALIRLVRNLHSYDPERPFGPWLRTIVSNCARREGGRQHRHAHTDLDDGHLSVVPAPEHALDVARKTSQAVALFDQLSNRQREVMHLCTRDGLSPTEAAETMGIAPATARVLLCRARRFIRTALWEETP